jgi:hypothetical protein
MTTTPVNAISRDMARLEWVWRSLTPLERRWWRDWARMAGEPWAMHRLFLECRENGEK